MLYVNNTKTVLYDVVLKSDVTTLPEAEWCVIRVYTELTPNIELNHRNLLEELEKHGITDLNQVEIVRFGTYLTLNGDNVENGPIMYCEEDEDGEDASTDE